MLETLFWLAAAGVAAWLIWRGGAYKWAGLAVLAAAAWRNRVRYVAERDKLLRAEQKAVEEFSAKTVPRQIDRRRRLSEARETRKRLESLEDEYDKAKADHSDRVADLWNSTFGREVRGPRTPSAPDDPTGDDTNVR